MRGRQKSELINVTLGNILAWKKQEGDKIAQGDIIAQIETGKQSFISI